MYRNQKCHTQSEGHYEKEKIKVQVQDAKRSPIATITGIVTKSSQRRVTATSKVMTLMMIEVQSDKRSNYPMRVIVFDERALNLMLYRKRQTVTIKGGLSYWYSYQLVAFELQ